MEELFAALSTPSRLWVLQYLAANGPTKQVELARAFAQSELGTSSNVNPGAMSHLVRSLMSVGLITRPPGSRQALRLKYEEQTRRLLSTASALSVAIAGDSHTAADRAHAQLMRDLTSSVKAPSADEESGT